MTGAKTQPKREGSQKEEILFIIYQLGSARPVGDFGQTMANEEL